MRRRFASALLSCFACVAVGAVVGVGATYRVMADAAPEPARRPAEDPAPAGQDPNVPLPLTVFTPDLHLAEVREVVISIPDGPSRRTVRLNVARLTTSEGHILWHHDSTPLHWTVELTRNNERVFIVADPAGTP